MLVPAGSPAGWRSSGRRDLLSIYLEPGLVERVAAEAFDLDPARLTVPPLDGLELPHLRAAMTAVGAELASGDPRGPLAPESLANLLAVHLIPHLLAPRRPERGRDGAPPRGCRRTSTSSCVASSGPSSSCKQGRTCPWRRSPCAPASRTRASSPVTSSASSASRRGSSGRPQESTNSPQVPPRNGRATRL